MNLRKDHCTHKLQSQPPILGASWRDLFGGARCGVTRRECVLTSLHSEALRVAASRGLVRGTWASSSSPRLQYQLLVLSPPAGTLARGARSRPNPLAVTGLDPGLVPAGWGVLPREARDGLSAQVPLGFPRAVLVGWKPDAGKNF